MKFLIRVALVSLSLVGCSHTEKNDKNPLAFGTSSNKPTKRHISSDHFPPRPSVKMFKEVEGYARESGYSGDSTLICLDKETSKIRLGGLSDSAKGLQLFMDSEHGRKDLGGLKSIPIGNDEPGISLYGERDVFELTLQLVTVYSDLQTFYGFLSENRGPPIATMYCFLQK